MAVARAVVAALVEETSEDKLVEEATEAAALAEATAMAAREEAARVGAAVVMGAGVARVTVSHCTPCHKPSPYTRLCSW